MRLKAILSKYHVPVEAQSSKAGARKILIAEIEKYQNKNKLIYTTTLVLLIALLVVAIVLVVQDVRSGANKLAAILGASGIGIAGLLEMMRRAAREWAQSSLVLGVARVSDEQRLQALIDAILKS
jgi:heme/copper-type cytochrome/quinol oxidase subunit 4